MREKDRSNSVKSPFFRAWFALTAQERWFIAGILMIALVGLTARYFHLKNERAEPYQPERIGVLQEGGAP